MGQPAPRRSAQGRTQQKPLGSRRRDRAPSAPRASPEGSRTRPTPPSARSPARRLCGSNRFRRWHREASKCRHVSGRAGDVSKPRRDDRAARCVSSAALAFAPRVRGLRDCPVAAPAVSALSQASRSSGLGRNAVQRYAGVKGGSSGRLSGPADVSQHAGDRRCRNNLADGPVYERTRGNRVASIPAQAVSAASSRSSLWRKVLIAFTNVRRPRCSCRLARVPSGLQQHASERPPMWRTVDARPDRRR